MNREEYISLVKSSEKGIRRFLTALCCGDTQLANDIAQDAFVKAYLAMASCKDSQKFRSWIFRIAYNTFLNQRRSQRVFSDYDDALNMTAETRSDDTFKYQALYQALAKIPSHERTTILLFYMEGYSAKEISQTLEISQEAVRQQLSRGRVHLRNILQTAN